MQQQLVAGDNAQEASKLTYFKVIYLLINKFTIFNFIIIKKAVNKQNRRKNDAFSYISVKQQIQDKPNTQNFINSVSQMEKDSSNQPIDNNPNSIPQHSRFEFSQPREPHIFFNSKFDSGNMHQVVKTTYDHYSIWTASDAQGTPNEGYPKSWFYFEVGGFINRKVSFSIHRVHFLYAMCKHPQAYRPVYRIHYEHGQISQWDRLPYQIASLFLNDEEELVLKFDFLFNKLIKSVEFAFIHPYSYEQCRRDLLKLQEDYQNDRQLFLGKYELTRSVQGRIVDMLVISSHQGREGFQITKGLPFSDQKIVKYRNNKPIIFISSRVHPIETPSSFTMNGILAFLLDKKDARAYLLRKYFVFVLIPMLNPDGVARGHCRMDSLNQNLNRYYSNPDPEKQPSCFAVRKLCEHYNKDKRLFMYLDLHAHPAYKGNFMFGNAIYEFIQQVQSQLFPKVLSQNCINFQFQQCIFSRKHMKAKDRNQDISKQGCGRVIFYKDFGLVHSYTLQCGYHLNSYDNTILQQKNKTQKYVVKYRLTEKGNKIYEGGQKTLQGDQVQDFLSQITKEQNKGWDVFEYTSHYLDSKEDNYYKRQIPTYTIDTFLNLGRNILISILDIWNKNPYSRLEDMNSDRKQIAEKQSKLDRFRKEQTGIKAKQKKIVELIEQQFYGEWHKRNIFNVNATITNNRDKKRNLTLQFNKVHPLLGVKYQKSQKVTQKQQIDEAELISESRQFQGLMKDSKILAGSESLLDHKGFYSRNFKVSRGKQTSSAIQGGQNRQKEKDKQKVENKGVSINKQILAAQIRLNLQQQVSKVAVSSKVIKGGLSGIRMRNIGLTPSRK